jgi:hypothetical protein
VRVGCEATRRKPTMAVPASDPDQDPAGPPLRWAKGVCQGREGAAIEWAPLGAVARSLCRHRRLQRTRARARTHARTRHTYRRSCDIYHRRCDQPRAIPLPTARARTSMVWERLIAPLPSPFERVAGARTPISLHGYSTHLLARLLHPSLCTGYPPASAGQGMGELEIMMPDGRQNCRPICPTREITMPEGGQNCRPICPTRPSSGG